MADLLDFPSILSYATYTQEIIFASGSLSRLSEAIERFGWQRLMLCTSHSARAIGHVASVEALLEHRLVTVFDRVQPHVQDVQVDQSVALAAECGVDAIIGLGGGSSLGMAKAVASKLGELSTAYPG